jgi:hypothetical protein
VGLQPLASWDYGSESCRGHGFLWLVSVVRCQVEAFATDRSLVQRSPTECGLSECDRQPRRQGIGPFGPSSHEKKNVLCCYFKQVSPVLIGNPSGKYNFSVPLEFRILRSNPTPYNLLESRLPLSGI